MELDEQREEKIDRDELIKMKNEKAEQVVQSRILTQAEHEMIKAEQALKNVVDIRRNKTMGLDQSANSSNLVPLSKIELVGSRRVSFCRFTVKTPIKRSLYFHFFDKMSLN